LARRLSARRRRLAGSSLIFVSDRTASVVLRPGTAGDVDALAEISVSSARHHAALDPEFYAVPVREAVATSLREALERENDADAVRLVAEVDGVVVGSATVELRSPSPGSMLRPQLGASVGLAVLDDRRGAGIGSRLMEAAEAWASERGASLMMLGASVGLAVLDDRRGPGIGSRLMEAAEAWASERGASLMMLDASAANADALRFYEQRHGYRLSGVLLRKRIGTAHGETPNGVRRLSPASGRRPVHRAATTTDRAAP